MKKSFFLIFAVPTLMLSSCAKVYYSTDAFTRSNSHNLIAIAPPKVSIAARKKVDPQAIRDQEKTESTNFQQEMYSWLLKRKMQNRLKTNVEIQDIETTNAKLNKLGYFDDNPMTPDEICEVLEVDALLTSNYSLSKPMSEGAAVALGLLVGVWGPTNQTTVTVAIYDKETKKMIWNYNHKVSGSVGSSPAQLVDNLMRNASKKSPYSR